MIVRGQIPGGQDIEPGITDRLPNEDRSTPDGGVFRDFR